MSNTGLKSSQSKEQIQSNMNSKSKGEAEEDIELDIDVEEDNEDDEDSQIDFTCNVCRLDEAEEENPLVVCDKCLICVHKECYGSPLSVEIPQDEWFCDRCVASADQSPCALCPVLHGIMKRTSDFRWCHLACAQWIPEVFFRIPENQDVIDYLTVPLSRWNRLCTYCQTTSGATMDCSHAGCGKTFHITCGLDQDIYLEYKSNSKGADVINALCSEHARKWKLRQKRTRA